MAAKLDRERLNLRIFPACLSAQPWRRSGPQDRPVRGLLTEYPFDESTGSPRERSERAEEDTGWSSLFSESFSYFRSQLLTIWAYHGRPRRPSSSCPIRAPRRDSSDFPLLLLLRLLSQSFSAISQSAGVLASLSSLTALCCALLQLAQPRCLPPPRPPYLLLPRSLH